MNDSDIELTLRQSVCEIGHRIWQKGYVAANDGNISVRLSDNRILCTPTMVSKGFMKPDELPIVDLDGVQLSGALPRTSEVRAHIEVMKHRPDVAAIVHAHPPHATAFCIARQALPCHILPEIELFLSEIPMVSYATPGTQAFADSIIACKTKANAYLLESHGALTLGQSVEECYYRMEMLDQYCRILILAKQLAGEWTQLNSSAIAELSDLRQRLTKTVPSR